MKKRSNAKSGFFTFRILFGCFLCLCALSLAMASFAGKKRQSRHRAAAPTPAQGTISAANPVVTYMDGPFVVPNATAQAGDPVCTVPMSCSDFALTVNSGDPNKQVEISVSWPVSTADFDVYIYAGSPATGGAIATSASSADPEVVTLPSTSGVFTIRVVPFAPAGQTYTATVALKDKAAVPPPGSAPPTRFLNYPAPASATGADSAGEPSIGVDWNPNDPTLKIGPNPPTPGTPPMNNVNLNIGGVAFFTANLNEFRVNFDDCSSPAKNVWEDVTFATEGAETLDPIGFVDHQLPTATGTESGTGLGRVFQSQLAGASSVTAYSDDDGATYTQSQGSGQPAGVDHQTVGGGSYAPTDMSQVPPVVEPPHPLYPHQIYYASQDIGTAFAARSDDGGLTFGPGVPMWNITQCGGLHGHVKVGPDGTVYVPNKSCTENGSPMGASVAVSRDNGVTWTIRHIHEGTYDAGSGASDPSVGFGSDNTLYVGYQNSDNHPHIAVSSDHGASWHDVDVSGGLIQNAVFPEVVAGDGDRAAFGFLGTSDPGGYTGTNTFRGVWYFYVATTTDRGQSYTLVDATNGDPVQIGSICTGGTTCGGDRNLLDFNDLHIDREGRVIAAYADGCLAPSCTAATASAHGAPYGESRSALASVLRQSGGPRLLSAYDSQNNCAGNPVACAVTAPGAPRVDRVFRNGGVEVDWSTPDNGGAPILSYNVYRKTGAAGTYAVIANVTRNTYLDNTAADPAASYFYKVTSINSAGESNSCGEFPVGASGPQESTCVTPGLTILTDPTGDELDQVAAHDVQSLRVSEAFVYAPSKIAFTLKMQSLATVPPNTEWPATFTVGSVNYTVRMTTSLLDGSDGTTPLFQVGPTGGTFAPADAASNFTADGTITIVVPRSAIGNPAIGSQLTGFLTRITVTTGAVNLTPDNMPDGLGPMGTYTVVGNNACAPNAAPVAILNAYPEGSPMNTPPQGNPPINITLDGSGSSDPDASDSVASYTFTFGDGTAPVTQASPTIVHTYTSNGNFTATLSVTDSRGLASDNVASKQIIINLPVTGIVSRKLHTGVGSFDINLLPDPSTGKVNVECRQESPNGFNIIFTFGPNYTVTGNGTAAFSNGGTVTSQGQGPNANQYQVFLSGVTNARTHEVTLNGVPVNNSAATVNGGNATLNQVVGRFDVLLGDTTNSRATNSTDVSQTKAISGTTTNASNFRNDVTVNGIINSSDTSTIKSVSGTFLP